MEAAIGWTDFTRGRCGLLRDVCIRRVFIASWEKRAMKQITIILATMLMLSGTAMEANAAGKAIKGAELTALLNNGKTLTLGGKGEGYSGTLILAKDGTAKGSVKTDDGKTINLVGTWKIKGDKFCRTWTDLDSGKEVCETWRIKSPTQVEVYVGKTRAGLNSW